MKYDVSHKTFFLCLISDFDFNRNLCSHFRSVFLFIESIQNDRCHFIGTPCENYESFLDGKCDNRFLWRRSFHQSTYSRKVEMGYNAKMSRTFNYSPEGLKYFLKTDVAPPFCVEDFKDSDCAEKHNRNVPRKWWVAFHH